jgi:formiminotetrahydrofolate cyclodeaminase
MTKFKNHSLKKYLDALSAREPVPGGGSAAALAGALGAGLIGMVTQYSLGKSGDKNTESALKKTLKNSNRIRQKLLDLVDRDAEAYLEVVKARKGTETAKKKAQNLSKRVPLEICQLCYDAIQLAPFLVVKGNKYLLSDVEAAVELLQSAFRAASIFTKD